MSSDSGGSDQPPASGRPRRSPPSRRPPAASERRAGAPASNEAHQQLVRSVRPRDLWAPGHPPADQAEPARPDRELLESHAPTGDVPQPTYSLDVIEEAVSAGEDLAMMVLAADIRR